MNTMKELRKNCSVSEGMRYFLLMFFIALSVTKLLLEFHEPDLPWLTDVFNAVLEGNPSFVAFQNRLLGPWIVHLISKSGYPLVDAYAMFIILMTLTQFLLLFFLLRKMKVSYDKSLQYILIFSAIFLCVQCKWFYPWDSIDLIIFTLFSFGVFQESSLVYFCLLFLIALLNRESALFISTYVIINSFRYRLEFKNLIPVIRMVLVLKLNFVIGVFLTSFGVLYIKLIRNHLYVPQLKAGGLSGKIVQGNHINFTSNIYMLFYKNINTFDIVNTIFLLGSLGYITRHVRFFSNTHLKAFMVLILMFASILIFGQINETRMYIILIPFLVFFKIQIDNLLTDIKQ